MKASYIISENKSSIIERWIAKVRKEIPVAREHDLPILRNNVPDLIEALVDALRSDDARNMVYQSDSHGKERAEETNYSLVQVLHEYRLLKEVLFNVIDEHGDNIDTRERDGIMFAIDQAMEQATGVFYEERTSEIKEARYQAEALSQKLKMQNMFRDRFVATLTHDLRGPLNNTLQLIDLLEEKLPSDDAFVDKVLDKIKLSIGKGNQLIGTMLDVSRIEAGESLPIDREQGDLMEIVLKLIESFGHDTRSRLKLESNKDTIIGYWDNEAISRAIENLITNAIKYGAEKVDIHVKIDQSNSETVIAVHNHGKDIPKEKLDKLFDLYYRAEDTNGQKGWGLGLTLVKGVAEAHGGKINVESHPEDGTTFYMVIPCQSEHQ